MIISATKRLTMLILIGFNALSLTNCARPSERIVTVTQEVMPPQSLLESCEKPRVDSLETNRDLARLASELAYSLDVCSARIEALRVFYKLDQVTQEDP